MHSVCVSVLMSAQSCRINAHEAVCSSSNKTWTLYKSTSINIKNICINFTQFRPVCLQTNFRRSHIMTHPYTHTHTRQCMHCRTIENQHTIQMCKRKRWNSKNNIQNITYGKKEIIIWKTREMRKANWTVFVSSKYFSLWTQMLALTHKHFSTAQHTHTDTDTHTYMNICSLWPH